MDIKKKKKKLGDQDILGPCMSSYVDQESIESQILPSSQNYAGSDQGPRLFYTHFRDRALCPRLQSHSWPNT
ncbi:hypothetical protein SO802_001498 [Lithocarpus litseifolius]|uniref:Uncharacterized protein n=1 Tax=Lithocarpus litseifolius TaxID=425828 RepID=A0AAW2DWE1_9ROSI